MQRLRQYLRLSPWLIVAVLMFVAIALPALGKNAVDLMVWPMVKVVFAVWLGYLACKHLVPDVRLQDWCAQLVPGTQPDATVALLVVGLALMRALIVGAVVLAFALSA